MKRPFKLLIVFSVFLSLMAGLSGCWNSGDSSFQLPPYTPEPFDQLDRPLLLIEPHDATHWKKSRADLFVIDTDLDQVAQRIPLPVSEMSVRGDPHLAPNGRYYFVGSGYTIVQGRPQWEGSQLFVIDPKVGDITKRIDLPQTTDQMSQIARNGRFITMANGYSFEEGRQWCLIDTQADEEMQCSFDPYDAYGEREAYPPPYLLGEGRIAPRSTDYVYYTKDSSPEGSVLFRMDTNTQEVEQLFDFRGLTLSPFHIAVDESLDQIYVAIHPALIQGPDYDPRYTHPHLEIISLSTGQLLKVIPFSVPELFGTERDESEVYMAMTAYDPERQKLYVPVTLYMGVQDGREVSWEVILEYDPHSEQIRSVYSSKEQIFSTITPLKGRLYLSFGYDWAVLNPETGELKPLPLGNK
jgi:hypothetical protein